MSLWHACTFIKNGFHCADTFFILSINSKAVIRPSCFCMVLGHSLVTANEADGRNFWDKVLFPFVLMFFFVSFKHVLAYGECKYMFKVNGGSALAPC